MLRAMRDEVIVKIIYETKTKNGIIIPEKSMEYKQYHGSVTGEVISVGPRSMFRDEIKPGDRICFTRHEGKRFYFENQEYRAVRDRWIRGKILDNETKF